MIEIGVIQAIVMWSLIVLMMLQIPIRLHELSMGENINKEFNPVTTSINMLLYTLIVIVLVSIMI